MHINQQIPTFISSSVRVFKDDQFWEMIEINDRINFFLLAKQQLENAHKIF
jgi:hypothetical protein